MYNLIDIARVEERRQALSTAEVAEHAEPIGGGWMAWAGPGLWANQACGLGLDGPVEDAALDRLVDFYASRGVEPRIEVSPFVDPSLVAGLARRGFVVVEFKNVLAIDLDGPEPSAPPVEGLRIDPLDRADSDALHAYIETAARGWRGAVEAMDPGLYRLTRRTLEREGCAGFLASIEGEPVGTGSMEITGSAASLFGASVLAPWRRRGVQAALIVARLRHARAQGCALALIQSVPGIPTERNALRLGFRVAYTKVTLVKQGLGLEPSP